MNQGNFPGNAYRYANYPMNSGGKPMISTPLQQQQLAQIDVTGKRMEMSQQDHYRNMNPSMSQYDMMQSRMGMQQIQNMRMQQQYQMNAAFQQKRPHISPTNLPVSYAQQNTAQYMQQMQGQHPGVLKMQTQSYASGQHAYPQMMSQMMPSLGIPSAQAKPPMMKPNLPVIGGINRDKEPKELPDVHYENAKKNLEMRQSTICPYYKVIREMKRLSEDKVCIICVLFIVVGEGCAV